MTKDEQADNQDDQKRQVTARYDAKTKIAVASTAALDRQGESIDQSGWDLKNFLSNPVILWAHDHSKPAIGSAPDMRISRAGGEKRLVFTPQFHEATEEARAIKFLYEGDQNTAPVLNSFSVGFIPKEFDEQSGTYHKQELLEVSAVNVPANADARMMAYKALEKGGFKSAVIYNLGIKKMDESQMRESMSKMSTTMDAAIGHLNDMKSAMGSKSAKSQVLDKPALKTKDKGNQAKVPSAAPKRKYHEERLAMAKILAKAADILNKNEKLPDEHRKSITKIIKRASEIIIEQHKGELQDGQDR